MRAERARRIGLFRYMLIREAADPALSTKQRGRLVRELAAREHIDPFGRPLRVTRWTLDRWIADWRKGGFDALVPSMRQSMPRTPPHVMELASALKRENPQRSAAQVRRIVLAQLGWAPDERTLQRMFVRTGLDRLNTGHVQTQVFGRFEASRPNEIWQGDALHGPRIGGRKTYLFAFIDDHSRAIVGARWGYAEDTVRLAAALRPALAARGVPDGVVVDNGSAFVDEWLPRTCAKLGIKLIHSTPYRPQGKGKIERFFGTVRRQFLVEIAGAPADDNRDRDRDRERDEPGAGSGAGSGAGPGRALADLEELNRLFSAWVEAVYHTTVHSETGQAPLERWMKGHPFPLPTTSDLAEAFAWSQWRTVDKTGLVRMFNNRYQVDPSLIGRKVELVFDPFDLTVVAVRDHGRPAGIATPYQIGRHAHPKARPEQDSRDIPPIRPTGIDYLAFIDTQHSRHLAGRVNYAALIGDNQHNDNQHDDAHDDDDAHEGDRHDHTASSGTASSGTASSGTASSGTASSGTASSGTASSGTASSGTASSGTASSGTASGDMTAGGAAGGAAGGTTGNPIDPTTPETSS